MTNNDKREPIKIILLGSTCTGKTSIINRYYTNTFSDHLDRTYSANFIIKEITINDEKLIIHVWDTAGQEQFQAVNKIFIKRAKIVILVYDVTSQKSFDELFYWYHCVKTNLGDEIVIGLAGNKVDLINEENIKEEVTRKEAKELAEKWDATFALLSAKCDKNGIDVFFEKLIKKYVAKYKGLNMSNTFRISSSNHKVINKQKKFC